MSSSLISELFLIISGKSGILMGKESAESFNGKPTIQGFYLKVNQWNYLKRLQKYIDLSIKETT
jgi:hypothetical protein